MYNTTVSKQIFQIKDWEIKYLINDTVDFPFFYRLLNGLCCFGNGFRYLFCSSSGEIEEVTFNIGQKEKQLKKDLPSPKTGTRFSFLLKHYLLDTYWSLPSERFNPASNLQRTAQILFILFWFTNSLVIIKLKVGSKFSVHQIIILEHWLLNQTFIIAQYTAFLYIFWTMHLSQFHLFLRL